jgi:hypothetical protein
MISTWIPKTLEEENIKQGMVARICNPRTRKAEAEESEVQSQPRLHRKTWFQKRRDLYL